MTAPVTLLVFALLLALVGPIILRKSSWPERSPRMGIAAWQALSASLLLTVLLAGMSLALPAIPWTTNLAELVQACAMALREQYSTPGGVVVSASGAIAVALIAARVSYCLVRLVGRASRSRRRQLRMLAMIAKPHPDYDALVVEYPAAAAYCLPGRGHHVVLTTAALAALDHEQLSAVLAHEHAHLRGQHHVILAVADALQHAFPGVKAFREARESLGRLVEMLADDAAARQSDRITVAAALVRLGEHTAVPAVALGAGGDTALGRVRRLVAPARPLGAKRTAVAAIATAALLALPLFLAIAPASAAGAMPPCLLDSNSEPM